MEYLDFGNIKFQLNTHDERIPSNVIFWYVPYKVGWYALKDGKWYGSFVEIAEDIEPGSMKEILLDQIKNTLK